MSEPTASLLAHAGDDNPRNYKRVGDEFRRLGEQAFGEAYYTDDIDARVARIRLNVPDPDDIRPDRAPDISADKYARIPIRVEPSPGVFLTLMIDWRDAGDIDVRSGSDEPLPKGWTYRAIEGGNEMEAQWNWRRWPKTSAAKKYIHQNYGPEAPQ